jgi:Tol biopolymer transport system component
MNSCNKDDSVEPPDYWDPSIYPHIDGIPVSSNDGTRILYYHSGIKTISKDGLVTIDPDSAGLWMIAADGTNPHLILKGRLGNEYDWNADGSWIVFEDGGQIYKVPLIGDSIVISQIQQLTFEGHNFFPSWSPDGEWIAYDSNMGDPKDANVIWVMRNDGTQKKDISQHGIGEWRMPGWSPDGQLIVHQRYIGVGAPEIVVMSISGENPIQLTHDDCFDGFPKYSPDGTKIAFQSQADGEYPQIWVVNANGDNLKKLTTDGGFNPCWIDSNTITYIGFRPRGENIVEYLGNHGTLWIMNADGNNKKQLTFFYGEVVDQR